MVWNVLHADGNNFDSLAQAMEKSLIILTFLMEKQVLPL